MNYNLNFCFFEIPPLKVMFSHPLSFTVMERYKNEQSNAICLLARQRETQRNEEEASQESSAKGVSQIPEGLL